MIKFNVYALNWNESRIIPAFLHHYREANRIIVFDNESSDDSVSLIKNAGREVVSFSSADTFDDQININLKNSIWKAAREENVDFVIVQDMDEFIYFPNWPNSILHALHEYKEAGVTCARCTGYNAICTDDEWDLLLAKLQSSESGPPVNKNSCDGDILPMGVVEIINRGYRFINEDKVLVFNPREIVETNYSHGAHTWSPTGSIIYPLDSPVLVHYKYIGTVYSHGMLVKKRDRLSQHNIKNRWGWEYLINDDEITKKLTTLAEKKYDLITDAVSGYTQKCKPFFNIITTILVLDRDEKRVMNVQKNCIPNVKNFRIQSAMDGADYPTLVQFQKEHSIVINEAYRQMALMGAIGCSFSHMQAWDYQIRNGIDHMIILEDDASLEKDFHLDTMNICSELSGDYDLAYLFVYPDHYKNTDEVNMDDMNFINVGYRTWCTVAYIVSLKGAIKLWNRLQSNLSDNIDNIIAEMIETNSLVAYSARKQFVKCIGQSVPWDDDVNKLASNIWSSAPAKEFL